MDEKSRGHSFSQPVNFVKNLSVDLWQTILCVQRYIAMDILYTACVVKLTYTQVH